MIRVAAVLRHRLHPVVQMNLPGALLLAALGLASSSSVRAADPAKVDYSERNTPYAPAASVTPDKRVPALNDSLQTRRVTPGTTTPAASPAAAGDRRADLDVTETRDKTILAPDSRRPEARTPELNAFDHRESRFQPDAVPEERKLAPRYQAALASARTTNITSSPAAGPGTTARINRFVFHHNTATPLGTTNAVPAGGGATTERSFLRATP